MKSWNKLLLIIYNALDFRLRNFFAFSRGRPDLKAESKAGLFKGKSAQDRAEAEERQAELVEKYRLEGLVHHSSRELYLKNLYYLDLLDEVFSRGGVSLPDPVSAADIGPSHWFYVRALWSGLTWWDKTKPRQVKLTGYEPDAYRIYPDFYSRIDHARAHLDGLAGVSFQPSGFPRLPEEFDLISQFFPFLFLPDHLKWGLPRKRFAPRKLMEDLWLSIKPSGFCLIINQGEEEFREQGRLLRALGLEPGHVFHFRSQFYTYQHPSWVTLLMKR